MFPAFMIIRPECKSNRSETIMWASKRYTFYNRQLHCCIRVYAKVGTLADHLRVILSHIGTARQGAYQNIKSRGETRKDAPPEGPRDPRLSESRLLDDSNAMIAT